MVFEKKEAAPSRLTVASYNIHQCVGRDRRRDPDRIAAVIETLGATIVGLQEVDLSRSDGSPSQLEYLSKALGLQGVACPTLIRDNGCRYGNALLTSHKVESSRLIDLSFPGREPRGALEVGLDVSGRKVRVIVTHFGLTGLERHYQVDRLCEAATNHQDSITIVLGDFNEWKWRTRTTRCLNDHYGRSTFHRTYPSWFPVFCLDRIFVRPREAFQKSEVLPTSLARAASDHLPVKTMINIEG